MKLELVYGGFEGFEGEKTFAWGAENGGKLIGETSEVDLGGERPETASENCRNRRVKLGLNRIDLVGGSGPRVCSAPVEG